MAEKRALCTKMEAKSPSGLGQVWIQYLSIRCPAPYKKTLFQFLLEPFAFYKNVETENSANFKNTLITTAQAESHQI